MQSNRNLVGKTIPWHFPRPLRSEWQLIYEGRVVAWSVRTKIINLTHDAFYDSVSIIITYDHKTDSATFTNRGSGEVVGVLENTRIGFVGTFRAADGRVYTTALVKGSGFVLTNQEGIALARTGVDTSGTTVKGNFTLLNADDPINPWLAALVIYYHASIVTS